MLQQYRRAMERRSLAPGTIVKRLSEVRAWVTHMGAGWPAASRADVEDWLDRRPLCARSRYGAISHLHAFYVWARREGFAVQDPTEMIERPRLPLSLPRPMPELAVDVALTTATGELRTMVALMAWAGLRCCEVARLDWTDVDLVAGKLHVTGKGTRDRVIAISRRLRAELAALEGSSGPVVGRVYTPGRVSQLVNGHLRACGIERHTAHSFRHRKLTRLCEQTGDILAVQQYAGHASIATTQGYVHVSDERLRRLGDLED